MKLDDIKRLSQIARDAGFTVAEWDYGWSAGAYKGDRNILIAKVYRPERDGYSGSKIIAEDLLREELAKTHA